MKRIFLIIFLSLIASNYAEAQKRPSITFHIDGKTYRQNVLVSKDGVIYKANTSTASTPPNIDWIQVATLSDIFSGNYSDLSNLPNFGTAAFSDTVDFATAAQGLLADTAVQPGSLSTVATTGSYNDLIDQPTLISNTSELTNDGSNGSDPFITLADIPSIDIFPEGDISIKTNQGIGSFYLDYFRDEANYGTQGFGSIDLSINFSPSATFGSTGQYSFTQGQGTTASGYGAWATGFEGISSNTYSWTHGYQNNSGGYASGAIGYQNLIPGDYAFTSGAFNNHVGRYGASLGLGLINKSVSTLVIGQGNEDYSVTGGGFNQLTSPLFIIGNGSLNSGAPNTINSRSTAFRINQDANVFINDGNLTLTTTEVGGSVYAVYNHSDEGNSISTGINSSSEFVIGAGPSLSSELLTIDQDGKVIAPGYDINEITDDKSLVTKEFLDNSYLPLSGGSLTGNLLFPNNGTRVIFGNDFEEYILNSTFSNPFENYGSGMIYAESIGKHHFTSSEGFGLYGDLYYHKSFIKNNASDSFFTELVNEPATQNNILTYPNKTGTFAVLDDLNTRLNKGGDTMSGNLNMDTNDIVLSDLSGDVQGIKSDVGAIEIYSDAYPVQITADGGLIVSNSITSNQDVFMQTNASIGGELRMNEGNSIILDYNTDRFSSIQTSSFNTNVIFNTANAFEFRNGEDGSYEQISTGQINAEGNVNATNEFRLDTSRKIVFDSDADGFYWMEHVDDGGGYGYGTNFKTVIGTNELLVIDGEDSSLSTIKTGTIEVDNIELDGLNVAPATSSSPGTPGQIRYTADYVYVCVAINTWKRSPLTTW